MIRAATPDDIDALYDICLRTGAAGSDATGLYENHRLLGSVYVGPYLTLPGTTGFVALDPNDRPAGYVLAADDTAAFELRCEAAWWPRLRERYPDPGTPSTPDQRLIHRIHHPQTVDPAVAATYPAHLHIDLLPAVQGTGTGRRLIETLLTSFRSRGVRGVHLGLDPRNTAARGFYEHLGFAPLDHLGEPDMMGRTMASSQ